MPPPRDPDNLTWITLGDFRGGLWERGNLREVPANGLLELVDAIPSPISGLRAGFRWSTQVNSSQPGTSQGFPASGNVLLGYMNHANLHQSPIAYHVAMIASTALPNFDNQLWLAQSTLTTALTSAFTTVRTFSSQNSYVPTRFVRFAHSSNSSVTQGLFFHTVSNSSAQAGVWKMEVPPSTIITHISTRSAYHLEAHQARLIASVQSAVGFRDEIRFSDDGTDNNLDSTGNRFILAANRPGDIACIYGTIPADLAILKTNAGWFKIGGAIAQEPVVYEAARVHPPRELSFAVETPAGLAYLTRDEGVWAFTGGREPTHLSRQIAGSPMVEEVLRVEVNTTNFGPAFLGQPAYAGTYLFTPKGYVHDFRTNAWHRVSHLSTSPPFFWLTLDEVAGHVWAARHTAEGGIQILNADVDELTAPRLSTYMFTTPLQYLDGHRVVVRELEYHLQTYSTGSQLVVDVIYRTAAGAESTVTLPTVTIPSTGNVQVRVQTGRPGSINTQLFRVRTHLSAPGTGEAPTLEKMRIGVVQADARIEVS